jgi:6-phospho-3-hexuloisomerase
MLAEIGDVFQAIDAGEATRFVDAVLGARRVFTYGVGREGLVLRGFCMRLFHLGVDAHVVGDMTTPRCAQEDLLVTSSGPGYFCTVAALVDVVHANGGRVALLTAHRHAKLSQQADLVVVIPGQTMAGETGERRSIQPMGSLYEQAMWLYLDWVVLHLADRIGSSFEQMASRHTNLE